MVERNRPGYGGRTIADQPHSTTSACGHALTLMEGRQVFVEVGAKTGIYSMSVAQSLKGAGLVIAIEPDPETASDLHQSLRLNELHNVRLRVCWISASIYTPFPPSQNGARPRINGAIQRPQRPETISMSLDQLLALEQLHALDYLRIDAPKTERDILHGAHEIICRFRPIIQCRCTCHDEIADLDHYGTFSHPTTSTQLLCALEDQRISVLEQLGYEQVPTTPTGPAPFGSRHETGTI